MKGWIITLLVILLTIPVALQGQEILTAAPTDTEVKILGKSKILEGPSILSIPGYFVWGGTVLKGPDGKYHMFFSRWKAGPEAPPFNVGWLTQSEICYAVSDEPDRNYKFMKVVLRGKIHQGDGAAWDAVSVHNPHIRKFREQYFLYYTGTTDPGKPPAGTPGASLSRRDRLQQNQQIGVIVFTSISDLLEGRFIRPEQPLLTPRTRVKSDKIINPSPSGTKALPDNIIVVNPSVVYNPTTDKYLLYFKGNLYDPNWRGVHGVAVADHPDGPFRARDSFVFNITLEDGRMASAEDPYVWHHREENRFYAVFKDFTGKITGDVPGLAVMHSTDGLTWTLPKEPLFMRKELQLKNGHILQIDRLERPQLLINDLGIPEVLFAACALESVNRKQDGSTFNVHIRLIKP